MKKRIYIILLAGLAVGTAILGYFEGGDITVSLIFVLMMVAILFEQGQ